MKEEIGVSEDQKKDRLAKGSVGVSARRRRTKRLKPGRCEEGISRKAFGEKKTTSPVLCCDDCQSPSCIYIIYI